MSSDIKKSQLFCHGDVHLQPLQRKVDLCEFKINQGCIVRSHLKKKKKVAVARSFYPKNFAID